MDATPTTAAHIAFLEDDELIAATVCQWLQACGHTVDWFNRGRDCAKAVETTRYDLCLFDWSVPDMPGPDVLARLRLALEEKCPPVIFASVRDSESDIVRMLGLGADDYLVKPISRPILLARINAVLRRARGQASAEKRLGPLLLDEQRRQVWVNGHLANLTDKETELAFFLVAHLGELLTRERLLQVVWRTSPEVDTRTVDVHMSALRRKLQLSPQCGLKLASIYGHGYRLESQDAV